MEVVVVHWRFSDRRLIRSRKFLGIGVLVSWRRGYRPDAPRSSMLTRRSTSTSRKALVTTLTM